MTYNQKSQPTEIDPEMTDNGIKAGHSSNYHKYVLYVQAGKGNVWHNGERDGRCQEDLLELPGMKME